MLLHVSCLYEGEEEEEEEEEEEVMVAEDFRPFRQVACNLKSDSWWTVQGTYDCNALSAKTRGATRVSADPLRASPDSPCPASADVRSTPRLESQVRGVELVQAPRARRRC